MKKSIYTKIPGRPDIELAAYYDSFAWYYPDCEMQTKEWFVKNAQTDWVYIDCGANIGYYSILFSQLSPQGYVYAVEPTSTSDMLARNLVHNRAKNVTVHTKAVGQYSGRRVEKVYRLWGSPPDEMEYDFTTIDQMVEEFDVAKLDCLKIDVDSFDFEVLIGAENTLQKFDPWLVVELNHALGLRGHSNMAALSWLWDRGYRDCWVLDFDNFILRKAVLPVTFSDSRKLTLNFPST